MRAKELGLNVVLSETYSQKAVDLSSIVLKLKALKPDVMLAGGRWIDPNATYTNALVDGVLVTKSVDGIHWSAAEPRSDRGG